MQESSAVSTTITQTHEGKPATRGTPAADLEKTHGFEHDTRQLEERKKYRLTSQRMGIICVAGAILFPIYILLDLGTAGGELERSDLGLIIGMRLLAGLLFGALAPLFFRHWFSPRRLGWAENLSFLFVGFITSSIVALMWDVVPDYYIGIGQLIVVRCVLLPGGPKRAIPICAVLLASLPLSLLGFYGLDAEVFTGAGGERVIAALSGLVGLMAVGMIGSYVYERALQGTVLAKHQDRYLLEAFLGQGGMGAVYRAQDVMLGRPCALKVIDKELSDRPELTAKRFVEEARKTSQLSGSHVIDIFDYGVTFEGQLFYAMEYLHGWDISDIVRRKGPIPAERIIHLGRQACLGLGSAHKAGLLHRDVKPPNLFVTERDEDPDFLVVLDFGLVQTAAAAAQPRPKKEELREVSQDQAPARLTQHGILVGTPAYLAPEQIERDEADGRTDVHALGCVLYFMLTGVEAYTAENQWALFMKKMEGPPPLATQRRPDLDIPADLAAVVQRCLTLEPEDRYQTMTQLRDALGACEAADRWSPTDARRFWDEWGRDLDDGETEFLDHSTEHLGGVGEWDPDAYTRTGPLPDSNASTATVGLGRDWKPDSDD